MSPYLHVNIADWIDGSSFEIWVLSPRKVLIVPGPKASVAALSRFVHYLFAEGWEGEVGEYKRSDAELSG